jgi:hypothetical protein
MITHAFSYSFIFLYLSGEHDKFLKFYQHTLSENKGIRGSVMYVNLATKGAVKNKGS